MKKLSLNYFAGYFDGEGCISIYNSGKKATHTNVYCRVSSVNPLIPNSFKREFKGNITKYKGRGDNHRDGFCWSVSAKKAEFFLLKIKPYLITKREEAQVALNFRKHLNKAGQGLLKPKELVARKDLALQLSLLKRKKY